MSALHSLWQDIGEMRFFVLLRVENISRRYDQTSRDVFRDVSFSLDRGETLALTGESGSGKSTLLHILAALDQPDSGRVLLEGHDIVGMSDAEASRLRRERIALVFQSFNLVPALSVRDNIALHAQLGRRFEADWTHTVVSRLGLGDVLDRNPEQLSGGQQQRVAIARALALKPDLLLADEPTGNLDDANTEEVLTLMQDLVALSGCALFLVTHSAEIAARCARHLHLAAGRLREVSACS